MKFRMVKINVGQFAILADEIPEGNIDYSIGLGFRYSIEGKRIAVEFSYAYEADGNKFLLLEMSCEFEIHTEDWDKAVVDGVLTIPKVMLEFFATQTVGTARGILFCKTEGTPFNHMILPPINVSKMIKNDLVAEL